MAFHQVFLTNNIKYIKKYLCQYSSEQIINSLIRIIRDNSSFDLNMYESLFLADNLDINQPSSLGGDTLLYSATIVNNLWMVKDLVARGADVNARCINGSYPLVSASLNQSRLEFPPLKKELILMTKCLLLALKMLSMRDLIVVVEK